MNPPLNIEFPTVWDVRRPPPNPIGNNQHQPGSVSQTLHTPNGDLLCLLPWPMHSATTSKSPRISERFVRILMATLIVTLGFGNYLAITSQGVLIWSAHKDFSQVKCTYYRTPAGIFDQVLASWEKSCAWFISVH